MMIVRPNRAGGFLLWLPSLGSFQFKLWRPFRATRYKTMTNTSSSCRTH